MPIIQVNLLEGRTVAQKRAMIAAVTDAVVASLGVKRETVRIMINEMHAEHFALGGVSAGEQPLSKRNGHPSASNGNGAHVSEPRHNGAVVE
jgi:4-oxalocrotonate tautomerase